MTCRIRCPINISSCSAKTLPTNRSVYNTTKYALEGLILSIAREVGPFNIRCNVVRPGAMNNERLHRVFREVAASSGKSEEKLLTESLHYFSMRSLVEMKEVADMVYFLASHIASHITGQIISVDGNIEYED